MSIKLLDQKTKDLEYQVGLLRSFVIGQVGKDPEGDYNPTFVKRALQAAQELPKYEFQDPASFLKHICRAK